MRECGDLRAACGTVRGAECARIVSEAGVMEAGVNAGDVGGGKAREEWNKDAVRVREIKMCFCCRQRQLMVSCRVWARRCVWCCLHVECA